MLPVLVEPADPTTASGRYPARRSSAIIDSRIGDAHPEAIVGRHHAEVRRADPEQLDRLADAAMTLVRDVHAQARPAGEAILAVVPARPRVAGRCETGQVGHRAAGDEDAARCGREADHVAKPVEDLPFQMDGGVVGDVAMRVHRGSQRVPEDRHDVGGRADPRPEPAVVVPQRVRRDLVAERLQQLGGFRTVVGKRSGSQRPGEVRRDRPKDRPVRRAGELVDHELDDLAPDQPDLLGGPRFDRWVVGRLHDARSGVRPASGVGATSKRGARECHHGIARSPTATSATPTPISSTRAIRSRRNSAARTTVTAGYSEMSTVVRPSRPPP